MKMAFALNIEKIVKEGKYRVIPMMIDLNRLCNESGFVMMSTEPGVYTLLPGLDYSFSLAVMACNLEKVPGIIENLSMWRGNIDGRSVDFLHDYFGKRWGYGDKEK